MRENISKEKEKGRYYTPEFIVNNILDLSGYYGNVILEKHVIDNSCGDGAFLCQVVIRYCREAINQNYDINMIGEQLSNFIHGIEIDLTERNKCVENVISTAEKSKKKYEVI